MREIYVKSETLFNQMCEEVFEALNIEREAFIDSQSKYSADEDAAEELTDAMHGGKVSKETLQ